MSPTPEPATGIYLDSCGTRYLATHHKKLGWHIQKQTGEKCGPPAPFQRPDFAASVNAGLFVFQPKAL